MQNAPPPDLFVSALKAELRAIPRPVFLCFAALGALSAGVAFVVSTHKPSPPPVSYVATVFEAGVSFVATYSACMWMIGERQSWRGFGRYLTTYLAMALPLALGLALLPLAPTSPAAAMAMTGLVLASAFALTLLPGWPLLQATRAAPVRPREAFRATKGIRWQLFAVSCMISALGSLPAVPKVDTALGAALLAALQGVVTCISLMLTTALAVAAWKHMTKRLAAEDRPG